MRIKFLSVIVSFILLSVGISSCLDSDDTYAFSTDPTLRAFGLDTIYGRHYKFTIDQLNRLVYNKDSMPVGADTLLDRILIDTMMVTGWISSGSPQDTLLSTTDSLDLTPAINAQGDQGIKLHAHAADGTERIYTLQIRVHRQDPDSLVWKCMSDNDPLPIPASTSSLKSLVFHDELLLYTSSTQLCRRSAHPLASGWESASVEGLPADADMSSLVVFEDGLYVSTAGGDVYRSADATTWRKEEALSGGIVTLVAVLPTNDVNHTEALMSAIQTDAGGTARFVTTTAAGVWTAGQPVPEGFPTRHISFSALTTANGVSKVVAVGMPTGSDKATLPWFTMDGAEWGDLGTTSDAFCPLMENPFIAYYGDQYYCFGGELDAIYTSQTGIAWYATQEKFLLPESLKGKRIHTITIDPTVSAKEKRDYIWVIAGDGSTSFEVWRGRLNRLGFEIQH